MTRYRVPSEILWRNGGWKEIEASSAIECLHRLREQGFQEVSLANVQVWVGYRWAFASEVPSYLGGYNRKSGDD